MKITSQKFFDIAGIDTSTEKTKKLIENMDSGPLKALMSRVRDALGQGNDGWIWVDNSGSGLRINTSFIPPNLDAENLSNRSIGGGSEIPQTVFDAVKNGRPGLIVTDEDVIDQLKQLLTHKNVFAVVTPRCYEMLRRQGAVLSNVESLSS